MPRIVLTLLIAFCLSACGPSIIKGESPITQVTAWEIDGDEIAAKVRIRNVNGEPMTLENLQLRASVENTPLLDHQQPLSITIPANGFETIDMRVAATADGTELLRQLQEGERQSLPYRLEGAVVSAENGILDFEREGHLYTVPGRPGAFR
jgi:LEA14-like dessication related protein